MYIILVDNKNTWLWLARGYDRQYKRGHDVTWTDTMEAIALTEGNRVLVPIATKWLASGIGDNDDDDDEHSSAGIVFWYMTVQLVET